MQNEDSQKARGSYGREAFSRMECTYTSNKYSGRSSSGPFSRRPGKTHTAPDFSFTSEHLSLQKNSSQLLYHWPRHSQRFLAFSRHVRESETLKNHRGRRLEKRVENEDILSLQPLKLIVGEGVYTPEEGRGSLRRKKQVLYIKCRRVRKSLTHSANVLKHRGFLLFFLSVYLLSALRLSNYHLHLPLYSLLPVLSFPLSSSSSTSSYPLTSNVSPFSSFASSTPSPSSLSSSFFSSIRMSFSSHGALPPSRFFPSSRSLSRPSPFLRPYNSHLSHIHSSSPHSHPFRELHLSSLSPPFSLSLFSSSFLFPVTPLRPFYFSSFPRKSFPSSSLFFSPSSPSLTSTHPSFSSSSSSSLSSFSVPYLPEYFHNYPPEDLPSEKSSSSSQSRETPSSSSSSSSSMRPGLTPDMERKLVGYDFGVRYSRASDDRYLPGFTQSRIASAMRTHKTIETAQVSDALGPPPPSHPPSPSPASSSSSSSSSPSSPSPASSSSSSSSSPSSSSSLPSSSSFACDPYYAKYLYDAKAAGSPPGDVKEYEASLKRAKERERRRLEREKEEKEGGFHVDLQLKLLNEGILSVVTSDVLTKKGDKKIRNTLFSRHPREADVSILLKRQVPVQRLRSFQWENLEVASAGAYLPPLHLALVRAVEALRRCKDIFGNYTNTPYQPFVIPYDQKQSEGIGEEEKSSSSETLLKIQKEQQDAAMKALMMSEDEERSQHFYAEVSLEKYHRREREQRNTWPTHLQGLNIQTQENFLRTHRKTLEEDLPAAYAELQKLNFAWEALSAEEKKRREEVEFLLLLQAYPAFIEDMTTTSPSDRNFSTKKIQGEEEEENSSEKEQKEEEKEHLSNDPHQPLSQEEKKKKSPVSRKEEILNLNAMDLPPSYSTRSAPPIPKYLPPNLLPSRFFKVPPRSPYIRDTWGFPLGDAILQLKKRRKFTHIPGWIDALRDIHFPLQIVDGIDQLLLLEKERKEKEQKGQKEKRKMEKEERSDEVLERGRMRTGKEEEGKEDSFVNAALVSEDEASSLDQTSSSSLSSPSIFKTDFQEERKKDEEKLKSGSSSSFLEELDTQQLRDLLAEAEDFENALPSSSRFSSSSSESSVLSSADRKEEKEEDETRNNKKKELVVSLDSSALPPSPFPTSPYYQWIAPAVFPLPEPLRRSPPKIRRGLRWRLQFLQETRLREEEEKKKKEERNLVDKSSSLSSSTGVQENEEKTENAQEEEERETGEEEGEKKKKITMERKKEEEEKEKDEKKEKITKKEGSKKKKKRASPFLGDRALHYEHSLFSRRISEGGFHYAFDKWSFDDVVEALQYFNDLYRGIKREEDGGKPLTFNCLPKGWCIPSPDHRLLPSHSLSPSSSLPEAVWPEEWWGMPLGKYLYQFQCGDIDAKFHARRRPILDRLGIEWKDPMKYLHFTWIKLIKGLRWWMMFRGQPLEQLFHWTVIPDAALVADICKPEEVQGLKIGYVVHMANRQEGVLYHYYPSRFEIYKRLNLNILSADRLLLDFPYKVDKEQLPLQGELGYMIPHVPPQHMQDV
ncbi:transmembrane protein [Cystoisospora suis]|uniref:Transmembrane protein n=1 Tax=Cystoisospora suis TaxID=483139 RepID=A0A2C6KPH9_9APIC|nr:transmembrane protein [Cystoisospora suis]